ncbi:hypothetical protein Rhe02_62640 [Rhizocola hellebori]|uniref:Endonuclease/exonuclease/phosphatase domain-containing protein n=1 Tax=Rhizocola hellebori TaxID=1392758 RepID=A0A8J3QEL8_9ACTN|nr:endonuclease/exonuclease/phosphatase family protein [Rhizocola hellebori]GIH08197.1 hypothetical protein Rhe02_62640 [Rhizocola hellebori]
MADITTPDVWDLKANPATLEALEQAWKAQAGMLDEAQDTVDRAANRVVDGEFWTGQTADAFDKHRLTLTTDLGESGKLAERVSRALGHCAAVLRRNQGLLDDERHRLADVPVLANAGQLTFQPRDDSQATLVNNAISAARDIRSRVDSELRSQAAIFKEAVGPLRAWQTTWNKRTLRVLNWNIQGGGGGNHYMTDQGTQSDDIPDLAERIINGDVDVATLQEVWKSHAEELQEELNKRAAPGEHWEVHFGKADRGWHLSDGLFPGREDAGNAVVVRTRPGVSTSGETVIPLSGENSEEGRAATKVHIQVD